MEKYKFIAFNSQKEVDEWIKKKQQQKAMEKKRNISLKYLKTKSQETTKYTFLKERVKVPTKEELEQVHQKLLANIKFFEENKEKIILEFRKKSTGNNTQQISRNLEIDQQCTIQDETDDAVSPADINLLQKYYSFYGKNRHVDQLDDNLIDKTKNTRTFYKILDKGNNLTINLKDTDVKKNYSKIYLSFKFELYLTDTVKNGKYCNYFTHVIENKSISQMQWKFNIFVNQVGKQRENLKHLKWKKINGKNYEFFQVKHKRKSKTYDKNIYYNYYSNKLVTRFFKNRFIFLYIIHIKYRVYSLMDFK